MGQQRQRRRADLQAFATQGREWANGKWDAGESHWMVTIDVEKDAALGWLDWQKYDFGNDNWGYTDKTDWLPDYNGNSVFPQKFIGRRSRC